MSRKEFWVFKGTSNFCQEMDMDTATGGYVKARPDGFYDVVSSRDTIEGGIHVVEVFPGEDLDEIKVQSARLRGALKDVLGLIEEGWLVRNISQDGRDDWSIRAVEGLSRLKAAHAALSQSQRSDQE